MKNLSQLTPINLLDEQKVFFSDTSYNPQFVYQESTDQTALIKYGLPQKELLDLAEHIIKQAYTNSSEEDLVNIQGPILSQKEATTKIHQFLKIHHLEKRFNLSWSNTYTSRTSITKDTIKLRLPARYRSESLIGMIYHEIGTHALRRENYLLQPWYRKKKKFGFSSYLETEEGLASLHTLLPKTSKLAHTQALMYLLVSWAQKDSFSQVWHKLTPYIQNLEKKWRLTYRVKRGLMDTSKPGGFTKDLLYFSGMVQVWRWLANHDFDPTRLYIGKCALEDIEKAWELNPDFEPALPSFFSQKREKYRDTMIMIGDTNGFANR